LLDANALFLPVRVGFPLDSEIDRLLPGAVVAVPTSVLEELDRLVEREVPNASAARALARRYPALASPGRGDDAVVRVARRWGTPVVTGDAELRDRLRAAGVAVLAPRDRHRLELHAPQPSRTARRGRRPANR
jgi:rRNA-processing protein FCF1